MKIKKLKIQKNKFDLNLKFYFLLKNLIKSKLTPSQLLGLLEIINLNRKAEAIEVVAIINDYILNFGVKRQEAMAHVVDVLENTFIFKMLTQFVVQCDGDVCTVCPAVADEDFG